MVLFTQHPKTIQIKEYIRKFPELFQVPIPQNWEENRVLTDKQLCKILEGGFLTVDDYTKTDNLWALSETLHYINPSLAIKLGVDMVLFGGAMNFLGTKKHKKVLDEIITGKKIGCFAMTEIGHGSNLKGLKTTAKKIGDKLVINTPDDEAVKCWIGGATIADYTTVFCQLYDDKNNHKGLHAILVPLKLLGVEIIDMGAKIGLNGIDNGFIRFTNAEVPLDNLLDRYGGFDEMGNYVSEIKNIDIRFGKMLTALSIGRISIAIGSYAISYKAFIIALKYNLKRKQFHFKGEKEEKTILEYKTQLSKFAMIYTNLHHMRLGILDLLETYKKNGIDKNLHSISSLLKVFTSWKAVEITNSCREMCGGHGYLWINQLGLMMTDVNIYQTFEGDNTVLIQQGVKWILDEFKHNKAMGIVNIVNPLCSKLEKRVNYMTCKLVFKIMRSSNVEKVWLDSLRSVVELGMEYSCLHLLRLSEKNKTIWSEIYSIYCNKHIISSRLMQSLLEDKVFDKIAEEWDMIHGERTDFIPITKYPVYLKSLL